MMFFFFNDTATTEIYTLSLHDALPILSVGLKGSEGARPATVDDVHRLALGMPHVTVSPGTEDRPVYQVGGKSFVFFRNRRPDAVDPETGERYDDVIVFWVANEGDKLALVQDESSPFFTTPHFEGHPSVLLRASRINE